LKGIEDFNLEHCQQSPTLRTHTHAHAHAHGFWVGTVSYYYSWVGIGFVHPCIQLQIGVKLLGCTEHANQEALRAEANDNERPFICPIQPRLGVGEYVIHITQFLNPHAQSE
jgi:hypothetical protein